MTVPNPAAQQSRPPAKPLWKRWYFWVGIIVVLAIIGAIQQAVAGDETVDEATPSETAAETPSETPSETPEQEPREEPAESPEPAGPPLAERVEAALYEANAKCDGSGLITNFRELCPSAPGFYIATIEDDGPGTVRVQFQIKLEKDEREDFARWVMQMGCMAVDDLDLVIGVDLEGYEQYWERSRSNMVCG